MNIQTNEAAVSASSTQAMLANPKFQALVRTRSALGWSLAAIMLVVYLALIGLVAFDKPLVAQPVGGGPTSLGIVLGVAVIVIAVVLVAIYVAVANTRFDAMSRDLKTEA